MSDYQVAIGLEVHIELQTKTKAFCSCRNEETALPNTAVCPVCLGLPGAVPSINKVAVEKTIAAAILLEAEISKVTYFERKNYFYPDLPKGYQIVQFNSPIACNGKLKLSSGKVINIDRVHLEENAGKLIHNSEDNCTYIDFNRHINIKSKLS